MSESEFRWYRGRCHCGTIAFEFGMEPIDQGMRCNCSICRRTSVVWSGQVVAPEFFRIRSGSEHLSEYRFGTRTAVHWFCQRCGVTPFVSTRLNPGHFRINLGCVDDLDPFAIEAPLFDGAGLSASDGEAAAKPGETPSADPTIDERNPVRVSYDPKALDLPLICTFIQNSYWGEGRSVDGIVQAIRHSHCVGLFVHDRQVGFARAVSDQTYFAYVFDLFVHQDWRGQGLGKKLMTELMHHPKLKSVPGWMLSTKDAHGLYEPFGFERTEPGRTMALKRRG